MEIFVQNQEQLDNLFSFLDKARNQRDGFRVVRRDKPMEGRRGVLAFFTDAMGKEHVCEAFYQFENPINIEKLVGPSEADSVMTDCLERNLPRFHDAARDIIGFADYEKSVAYVFDRYVLDSLSESVREQFQKKSSAKDFSFATYRGMTHLFKESPELERLLVENQLTIDEVSEIFRRNLKEHVWLKQHPGGCIR